MRHSLSATSLGLIVGLSTATCAFAGIEFVPPAPGEFYPGWGNPDVGKTVFAFDLGDDNRDIAVDSVVAADGGMYLAGTVRKANGKLAMGILRLDPSGKPDLNFHGDGMNTSLLEDVFATSMAIGNDRIYVAGYTISNSPDFELVVCQFILSNGANLDFPAANNGGCISPTNLIPGSQEISRDVLVQSDGKIVVAGTVAPTNNFGAKSAIFVRFNADGSQDTDSFGEQGISVVRNENIYQSHEIRAITQAANGKLIAAGWTQNVVDTGLSALVIRLDADGNAATADEVVFGYDGSPERDTRLHDIIAVDDPGSEDDAVIAVGELEPSALLTGGLIIKLTGLDLVDMSFGTHPDGGYTTIVPANEQLAFHDIAVDYTGAFVVSGDASYEDNGFTIADVEVRRFGPNGALDESFGVSGTATVDFGTSGGINSPAGVSARGDAVYVGSSVHQLETNQDFAAAKIALPSPIMFSDSFESL